MTDHPARSKPDTAEPPAGYVKMENVPPCFYITCPARWRDKDGNFWCCEPNYASAIPAQGQAQPVQVTSVDEAVEVEIGFRMIGGRARLRTCETCKATVVDVMQAAGGSDEAELGPVTPQQPNAAPANHGTTERRLTSQGMDPPTVGDDRESMETWPLKVASPEVGSPPFSPHDSRAEPMVSAECLVDRGELRKRFNEHYWDSLEHQKSIVLAHVKAVLAMAHPVSDQSAKLDRLSIYARDLRRNSSGGDDYPFELMRGVADEIDRLLENHSQEAPAPQDSLTVEQCVTAIEGRDAGYISCNPEFSRGYRKAIEECVKAVRALNHSQEENAVTHAEVAAAIYGTAPNAIHFSGDAAARAILAKYRVTKL